MSETRQPGQLVGGRYEIRRLLGRGGFGAVYAAVQQPLDRLVALKILAREHAERHEARERFLREARAAARLNHPLVVGVIDYGADDDGTLYIALEYIEGAELADIIKAEAPLSIERTIGISRDILRALQAAHDMGMVHRDLKPSNVMQADSPLGGRIYKLLDFGLARAVDDDGLDFRTRSGVLTGTPYYMSPEQAVARGVGPATDQYAFGVMLFQMLTGHLPFVGRTSFEVLAGHQANAPPRVGSLRAVPDALEAIVQRTLAKDPDDRFPDVGALLAALETIDVAATEPSVVPVSAAIPPPPPQPTPQPAAPSALLAATTPLPGPSISSRRPDGLPVRHTTPLVESSPPAIPTGVLPAKTTPDPATPWPAAPADDDAPPTDRRPVIVALLVALVVVAAVAAALLGRDPAPDPVDAAAIAAPVDAAPVDAAPVDAAPIVDAAPEPAVETVRPRRKTRRTRPRPPRPTARPTSDEDAPPPKPKPKPQPKPPAPAEGVPLLDEAPGAGKTQLLDFEPGKGDDRRAK